MRGEWARLSPKPDLRAERRSDCGVGLRKDGSVRADANLSDRHFALNMMAAHASLMIHELGHVLLGSGHCSFGCCMDLVAQHWLCKVRGLLGLPFNARWANDGDDYDGVSTYGDDHDTCSTDDGYTVWSCDVGERGTPGMDADFCTSGTCLYYTTDIDYGDCYEPSTTICG